MPKALADRFRERQAEKEKARLEREEKMRLKAQAKAAMAKPENPDIFLKPRVPETPIVLRPLEISIS